MERTTTLIGLKEHAWNACVSSAAVLRPACHAAEAGASSLDRCRLHDLARSQIIQTPEFCDKGAAYSIGRRNDLR